MWLHERVVGTEGSDACVRVEYCKSHEMCADLLTKEFKLLAQYQHALSLIGVRPHGERLHWGRMAEPVRKKGPSDLVTGQGGVKAAFGGVAAYWCRL